MKENHARTKHRRYHDRKDVVSFFAGGVCRYEIVLTAAASKGWKMVDDRGSPTEKSHCNIYWIDTCNINDFYQMLQPWQCINHFPGMTNITRKARMCQNLEIMRKKFPLVYSFYPKTYCLPRDLHWFRKNFGPDGKADNVFIIKPDGGCQGRGIFLTRNASDVPYNSLCVAQHYILNPLLIDGKKFDLRIYVLITSCKPLRVYLFNDGLVRICAIEFARPNTANLEDRCMHLTNYAVNKSSDKFVGNNPTEEKGKLVGSEGNKRSITWFLEWLRKERGEATVKNLWKKISHICGATILSIAPLLVREYNNIFGCADKLYKANMNRSSRTCSGILAPEVELPSEVNVAKELTHNTLWGAIDKTNKFVNNSSTSTDAGCEDTSREGKTAQPRCSIGGSRCFEVLGFDIMLDEHCTPILIETNHLPAFGADCPVDRSVKKLLMEQVLATVKAKPQDEKVYNDYLIEESRERLLGVKQSTVEGNDDEDNIIALVRKQLFTIYTKHAPCFIDKIPSLLSKYKGCEELLVAKARAKYVEKSEKESVIQEASSIGAAKLVRDTEPSSLTSKTISISEINHLERSISEGVQSSISSPEQAIMHRLKGNLTKMNVNDTVNTDSCDAPLDSFPQLESLASDTALLKMKVDLHNNTQSKSSEIKPSCDDDSEWYHRFLQEMLLEEEKLLINFERVYPPLESSDKYEKFTEIEKFIFEEYEKQQRRMTVPLHQCRSSSNSNEAIVDKSILSSSNNNYANNNINGTSHAAGPRPLNRGDSWITGNPYIRKATSPPKELPLPTQKQIETAIRLSHRRTKANRRAVSSTAAYYSTNDNVMGQQEQHLLSDCTNTQSQQQGVGNTVNNTLKGCNIKEFIAPINFEFGSLENIMSNNKNRSW